MTLVVLLPSMGTGYIGASS